MAALIKHKKKDTFKIFSKKKKRKNSRLPNFFYRYLDTVYIPG